MSGKKFVLLQSLTANIHILDSFLNWHKYINKKLNERGESGGERESYLNL